MTINRGVRTTSQQSGGGNKNELTGFIAYDWPLWGGISLSDDLLLPQKRVDRSSTWSADNETIINRDLRTNYQQSGDSKNELTHIAYDWPLWRKISLSDDLLLPQTRLDRSLAWFVDNETTINCGVRMTSQQSGGQQKWAYALDCIWLASLRRNISFR